MKKDKKRIKTKIQTDDMSEEEENEKASQKVGKKEKRERIISHLGHWIQKSLILSSLSSLSSSSSSLSTSPSQSVVFKLNEQEKGRLVHVLQEFIEFIRASDMLENHKKLMDRIQLMVAKQKAKERDSREKEKNMMVEKKKEEDINDDDSDTSTSAVALTKVCSPLTHLSSSHH